MHEQKINGGSFMSKKALSLLSLSLLFWITGEYARPIATAEASISAGDEVAETIAALNLEIELIDAISVDVEHLDFARLTVLKLDIVRLIETIKTKGLFHRDSAVSFYSLTKRFEFSKSLFQFITSEHQKDNIQKLQSMATTLAGKYGYDIDFATRHTFNDFTQMKKLFLQLMDLPISDSLRAKIRALDQHLIDVLGPAKQYGDRPITFERGKETYFKIQALYPDLENLALGNAAFDIVVEIQGLNETYAEFAQIFRAAGAGEEK